MDTATLAQYIGVPRAEVDALLEMGSDGMLEDEGFIKLVNSIDLQLLKAALPAARAAYDEQLPALRENITSKYNVTADAMSSHTLGTWIVGALEFPQYINSINSNHQGIPREVFANELPHVLNMVADIPEGAGEWQKALCIFSLPLLSN